MRGPLTWTVQKYSRISIKPGAFSRAALSISEILSFRNSSKFPSDRFLRANTFSYDPEIVTSSTYPVIEIVISVGPNEEDMIQAVVRSALRNCINPVSRVNLLVERVQNPVMVVDGVEVQEVDKYALLEHETLELIVNQFGSRSGWVLQQFNKLAWCFHSTSAGVLVLDADTFLTYPRLFLDDSAKQVLMPTWEMHGPYYEFLTLLNPDIFHFSGDFFSFVSHHMLFQPRLVQEMLEDLSVASVDALAKKAFELIDNDGEASPFSVDYELYGQWLTRKHPELVVLTRWCNAGLSRDNKLFSNFIQETDCNVDYASISFHHYM